MDRIDHFADRTRNFTISRLLVIGVAALLLGSGAGLLLTGNLRAAIPADQDCTDNAVMTCGCQDGTECTEKLHENANPGMEEAYTHFGLASSDYDRFAAEGVEGMAHPDGTVTRSDTGDVVMTNTSSIGRTDFGYGEHYPIDGHDFYLSSHSETGILQDNSLPVIMLMNSHDEVEFAMIKACGNPVKGDKVEKEEPPEKEPPKEEPPKEEPPKEERPPKEEKPPKELPEVGAAGSVAGIFAGATGVGAAAHRLITRKHK